MTRSSPPSLFTLILLSGLSALAMNLFQPSLPSMARDFGVDYRVVALSVPLYLATATAVQILVGPISDKVGRRPVILWSILLFLLATVGCVFATSAVVFLGFRMAQAVLATCMVLSRAAVRDMYEGPKAASMIGYVTMGMTIVPMVGPAFGGVIDQLFGWHANFWLLFAAASLTLAIFYVDFGETATKSGKTLMAQFRKYPELLRSPRFWGYSMASGLSAGSFFAYLGGSPFVGTEIYGLNSAELGIYLSAPAVGYCLGNFLSGRYSERFGINSMVLWGCVINIIGVFLSLCVTWAGLDSRWSFFGLVCLVGLGNGMTIPNATTGAISLRPHLAGTAAGLSSAIMIGVGAGLSATASWLLVPGSNALPLLEIMALSGVGGLCAILLVLRRERRLRLQQ